MTIFIFCWIQRLLLEPVHGLPCRSISRDCLQEEPICTVQLCDPRGQDDGLELLEARLQQHHLARPLLAWTENLVFFFCRFAICPFFLEIGDSNSSNRNFEFQLIFLCHYFLAFLGCTCLVFQGRNCNGWWMSWPIKAVGMRPTRTRSGCVARPDAWSSTCISGDHCCRPLWNLGAAWWKFWTPIRYLAEGAEVRSMLGRWCYLDVFWVL